ncbi:MAG: periplasmic heavy metal sensor [Kiritimatiellae bacterium]|nr:periplasmic heavy metal sensor [Kiritimatiellia bacterium]
MKLFSLMAVVALVGATFAAEAKRPAPREPGNDPVVRLVKDRKVAEKIGLTKEQIAQIKELCKAGDDAAKALREKHKQAMERNAAAFEADRIDENAVMAAIDEIYDLRKAVVKEQMKAVIAAKNVLSPEQLEKAKQELSAKIAADEAKRAARKAAKEGDKKPAEKN